MKFNTLKLLLHCCGNRKKKITIHCNTELMMQSKEPKARRK